MFVGGSLIYIWLVVGELFMLVNGTSVAFGGCTCYPLYVPLRGIVGIDWN